MEENKKPEMRIEPKNEKMSYEQLENIAHQLSEQSKNLYLQNQELAKKLEEANLQNFFRRLEYLWTIINSDTKYITEEFKVKCGKEFMEMMTVPEQQEEKE